MPNAVKAIAESIQQKTTLFEDKGIILSGQYEKDIKQLNEMKELNGEELTQKMRKEIIKILAAHYDLIDIVKEFEENKSNKKNDK